MWTMRYWFSVQVGLLTSDCRSWAYESLCSYYLGISGLVFARFYLDIHSGSRLAILEEDSSVGGVWSSGEPANHLLSVQDGQLLNLQQSYSAVL